MSFGETISASGPKARWSSDLVRRIFDLTAALAGLAAAALPMAVIAAAIWLEDGRPVFFSQVRIGAGGRPFHLYKFRKFRTKATEAGLALTLTNDPRLTRLGRFLGETKLDELPQLWNVLMGDMSLVGPRPEVPEFADLFSGERRALLEQKPGIFGPSQVFFRNEGALHAAAADPIRFYREVLFPLKARVDLSYFPRRTILGDFAWMMRSLLAVVGWSPLPAGADVLGEVEAWLGHKGEAGANAARRANRRPT